MTDPDTRDQALAAGDANGWEYETDDSQNALILDEWIRGPITVTCFWTSGHDEVRWSHAFTQHTDHGQRHTTILPDTATMLNELRQPEPVAPQNPG